MKISKQSLDVITTILGACISALVLANVDYSKLLIGDKVECGKAIGAVIIALNGWLTNKIAGDKESQDKGTK